MDGIMYLLIGLGGMLVYGFLEKSRGAERRARRQRKARARLRAERHMQREIEKALPPAVAHFRDDEQP